MMKTKMKIRAVSSILAAMLLNGVASTSLAHHSFPAEFDKSRQGELSGTIVKVWYKNPHVRYVLAVKGENDVVEEWDVQTTSVTSLRTAGWTPDTVRNGESVVVRGDLGRGDTKKLFMRELEKADGSKYYPFGPVQDASERNRIDADPDRDYGYAQVNPEHPFDISGQWSNGYKFQLTVDDLEPKPTPFTAAGKRVFDATEAWHDDALRCMPLGLPRILGSPYAMEIVDAGTHYLIVHVQNNTPRWVWMDQRSQAQGVPASSMGFSVGRWEGDTLVIETTNLSPGTLDGSLLPMSGVDTKIVEHWEFSDDRLSMDRTLTIFDSYYEEPMVRRRGSARSDSVNVAEPAPCDPDGYYGDLLETGRLAEHLQ